MKFTSAAASALMACSTFAQVVVPPNADPGALQQRRIDEEQRRQELERMERKSVTEPVRQPPPPAVPVPVAGSLRITVRKVSFSPASEILSAQELAVKAAEFEGKEVGIAELQQLAESVNALYREKGVVTARALIAPQDLSGGNVTIQLVEGRVGAITVRGNDTTRESYVLGRIEAEPGKLVDLASLQESLIRFNRTNDAQLRAELKPGKEFGRTDLEIGVVEPERHLFRMGLDNLGSEATGENRLALGYTNQTLLGFRDSLGLGLMSASGLKSMSLDYGFPVTRSGGRLVLAHNRDDTKIKYGPVASLGITGESRSTSLSLRQPVLFSERSQTDLLLSVRKRDVENQISGVFLSGTQTDDIQLGLEHQTSDGMGQWLAGLSLYNGKATTVGISTRYAVTRGSLKRTLVLAGGWSLRGSLSFQHTGDEDLPNGEYFFLGGEGSVRGYPVGQFSGDKGTLLALELQHPLVSPASGDPGAGFMASGFLFVDTGRVKLVRPPNSTLPASESLSSLGWGANLSIGRGVSARVTLAYALTKLQEESKRFSAKFQLNSQF